MKKIATLAEAYHTPLAPHCTAGFLGIAASLHVAASIPFFLIHEFYPENAGFNRQGLTRMAFTLDNEGYIGLPPGPGLGVEVDEQRIEQEAKPRKPTAGPAPAPRWFGRGLLRSTQALSGRWKFLKLRRNVLTIDVPEYYIDNVAKIMGILKQIVESQTRLPQAIVAA